MLDPQNCLLVVIDVQGKLALSMDGKDDLIKNVKIAIQGCQALDIPIVWAEQLPEKLGPTLDEVASLMTDISPNPKSSFSVYGDEAINSQINALERKQVMLIGIEAHVCVYQSARDLLKDGYSVFVLTDAISSRSKSNKDIATKRMADIGTINSSVEMALFELVQKPEGDAFKKLIRVLK